MKTPHFLGPWELTEPGRFRKTGILSNRRQLCCLAKRKHKIALRKPSVFLTCVMGSTSPDWLTGRDSLVPEWTLVTSKIDRLLFECPGTVRTAEKKLYYCGVWFTRHTPFPLLFPCWTSYVIFIRGKSPVGIFIQILPSRTNERKQKIYRPNVESGWKGENG